MKGPRALLLLMLAVPAFAWGPTGHRVVGLVAQDHLSRSALKEIEKLLRGETLVEAATWADEVRNHPNWRHAAPWHYVNIPDGESYKQSRKARGGDVLRAIERFEKVLRDRQSSPAKRADALRFLLHFVGDLHQPLHVGRSEDRGGNTIEVSWFGEPSNLHRVWDSDIIGKQRISYQRWFDSLDRPSRRQVERWQSSGPLDWAAESQAIRPLVYRIGDGRLHDRYYDTALPIVRERLVQAGVRLAALLEKAFTAR